MHEFDLRIVVCISISPILLSLALFLTFKLLPCSSFGVNSCRRRATLDPSSVLRDEGVMILALLDFTAEEGNEDGVPPDVGDARLL